MATIGYVTYNPGKDEYAGSLKTLNINAKVRLVPITDKKNDRVPDYEIFSENNARCGAAWKRTSEKGNEYISLTIDDISFPAPIYANLGQAAGQDDENVFAIIWNRPGA